MTGCGHGKVKREIEIWLIDNEELLLYRKLNNGSEQVIPLHQKAMKKFMCIDKRDAKLLIGDIIQED